jgi:hypothetical protein
MTTVRHIFLLQPRTGRTTIGCPAWGGKYESLRGLDLFSNFIYQTALAGNEEIGAKDAESGTQERRRATG